LAIETLNRSELAAISDFKKLKDLIEGHLAALLARVLGKAFLSPSGSLASLSTPRLHK
jgi:hypothetical protein